MSVGSGTLPLTTILTQPVGAKIFLMRFQFLDQRCQRFFAFDVFRSISNCSGISFLGVNAPAVFLDLF
jgi:hypothetical protein